MSWIDIPGKDFAHSFDRRSFGIKHALTGHPLLELPRLVQLAQRLESSKDGGGTLCFHGDHDINQVDEAVPTQEAKRTFIGRNLAAPELCVAEIVEQIQSCNAWLQLRNIGIDPEYGALVGGLIEEFRPHVEALAPAICGVRGDVFVSSPHAVTPFHMDEEHNFLFQIQGRKSIAIADGANREVVREDELISFFKGESELARYTPHFERHSARHEIGPGDGVHIPPCYPHWVKNGDAVSISLGVVWHSDVTADRRRLYLMNARMRQARLNPRPVGASPGVDRLKLAPFIVRRRILRALRRSLGKPEIGL